MRRHSLSGPLVLLLIGGLFLWRNLHPEAPVFDLVAQYWPFLLIAWGFIRLFEVLLSWRNDGSRHTFTGGEVALVVLICMAGSGIWMAHRHSRFIGGTLDFWGTQFEYPVTANASAAGAARIVFENTRGNITVTGADALEVSITGRKLIRADSRADADRTNQNTAVEIVPQGDRLLVRANLERAPDNQRVSDDLTVTVPRGMAVEARGRAGDFDISDLSGDVDLNSERGDVRLSRLGGSARIEVGRGDLVHAVDVKGKIDLHGRGSDIDLENVAGQVTIDGSFSGTLDFKNLAKPLQFAGRNTELRVAAIPGTISMNLSGFNATDVVGPVRLVTRSRDVRLERFTESLDLDAQLGDIFLDPGRLPLPSIEARSGSGRIELVLPEKAAFQLQATAQRGDAVNDYGPQIQREVSGRTATLKGKVGDGPTIQLTSERGTISVRREGAASTAPATKRPADSLKPGKATEI
jgi:hypothetical protein